MGNLSVDLSLYVNRECIIKASGSKAVIKDYYRRRTGTGGLGVRFIVQREGETRCHEYEPALLDIDLTKDVPPLK